MVLFRRFKAKGEKGTGHDQDEESQSPRSSHLPRSSSSVQGEGNSKLRDKGKGKGKEKEVAKSKRISDDGYGIRILHDPKDANADIVFIHGLTGGQISTWTAEDGNEAGSEDEESNENEDQFDDNNELQSRNRPWPQSILASDLPTARISAFGYDADVVNWGGPASQNRIDDHARNLVAALANLRSQTRTTNLSIIFVAHSLGGLVCKNALVLASIGEDYQRKIFESTHAIAFLGTPHHGAQLANRVSDVASLTNKVKRTNSDILRVLEPKSEVLEMISNNFHQILANNRGIFKTNDVKVTCFLEEFPVKRFGFTAMVVPRESGRLFNYNHLTIHADHIGMTKFKRKEDAGYVILSGELKKWMGAIDTEQDVIDPNDRDCLATLFVTDPSIDRAETEMLKGGLVESACSWIKEDPVYLAWFNTHAFRQTLWIHGDPGKGKTMIALLLIKQLLSVTRETGSPRSLLAYYICSAPDESRNSALAIAKSLLYQVLKQEPSLLVHVRDDFAEKKNQLFSRLLGVWDILERVLSKSNAREIYLIIDALDECNSKDIETLLRLLRQGYIGGAMNSRTAPTPQGVSVKVILLSRWNSEIESHLAATTEPIHWGEIDLEKRSSFVTRGVEEFVSNRVTELANWKKYSDKLRDQVEKTLREKAGGTFLWVALACQQLRQSHVKSFDTIEYLDGLPSGLPDIYQRILQEAISTPNKKRVLQIKEMLRSIVTALRPLSLDELAVTADLPLNVRDDREMLVDFVRQCGSLITIRASTVYLVHQSAKDFLVSLSQNDALCSVDLQEEHVNMTIRCLRYICTPTVAVALEQMSQQLRIDREEDPSEDFVRPVTCLDYPVMHWIDHGSETLLTAKTSQGLGKVLNFEDFDEFLQPHSKLRQDWLNIFWNKRHSPAEKFEQPSSETFTSLHLAAYAGLVWLTENILQAREQDYHLLSPSSPASPSVVDTVNEVDSVDRTPLHWAMKGGHLNVVQILLNRRATGVSRDIYGKNALELAAEAGNTAVVQKLLQHSPFVQSWGRSKSEGKYGNALQLACAEGREEVVQILLDKGAEPNYYDQMILDMSLLANTPFWKFMCSFLDQGGPIIAASENGHAEIVSMLLKRGADVNANGGRSGNALYAACEYGSESIVTMLLNSGADIDALGGHWGTALNAASYKGHEHVVKLLLEWGANPNSPNDGSEAPLQAASSMGHRNIVRMLLEKGAAVNYQLEQEFPSSVIQINALQAAAAAGDEDTIRILLEAGAHVDEKVMSSASKTGNARLVALLLRAAKGKPLDKSLEKAREARDTEESTQQDSYLQDQHEDSDEAEVAVRLEQGARDRIFDEDQVNKTLDFLESTDASGLFKSLFKQGHG